MQRSTKLGLGWSLLATAAIALMPALPVHAGIIPDEEREVRALIAKVAETGDLNTMSKLLTAGLDINLQDENGQPALVTATLAKQDDMVRLLLDHKADVMTRTKKGMTALHAAAYVGNLPAAKLLMAHGAYVNDQANFAHITALHGAAEENHLASVKALVDAGTDMSLVDVKGYTASTLAGWKQNWDVVQILVKHGDICQPEAIAGPWVFKKCMELTPKTALQP